MKLQVAYFGVGIGTKVGNELSEGEKLRNQVRELLLSKGLEFVEPNISEPQEYMSACATYDIVILDASIEDAYSTNYKFAMPFPADYILVMSRTNLPLNFYGFRDASLEPKSGELYYNSPMLIEDKVLANEKLLVWLTLQLDDLIKKYKSHSEAIKVQKDFFRKPISKLFNLLINPNKNIKGWDTEEERRKHSGQVFISFRNIQDENGDSIMANKLRKVKDLVESGQFPGVEKKTVRYFEPNSLSSEIMSEQRRWQILAMIDRFIGPAQEVWVYEISHSIENKQVKAENYYYNSWWTLGELLTLAYRGRASYIGEVPRVKILKEKNGSFTLEDAPPDFLPELNEEHRKRMARWYANCDPAQMAPESVLAIRAYPEMPIIGFMIKQMKYFNDHVWKEEFWEDPILDCSVCRTIGKEGYKFNVDNFLWTKGDWFTRIKKKKLKDGKKIKCKKCNTKYTIYRKDISHYYWIPPVRRELVRKYYLTVFGFEDEITDDYDYSLVKLPVYDIKLKP